MAAQLPPSADPAQMILDGGLLIYDDFNRADTTPGTLGGAYDLRGAYVTSFPLPPATSGQVQNGAFVDNSPYTVYATQSFGSTVYRLGATVSWQPSTGTASTTEFAMLISANNNFITDMVHFSLNRGGWLLQVRGLSGPGSTSEAFVTIASQNFASIWPDNGTPLTISLSITGQTVTVDANGKITTVSDPRVPSLVGPYAVWEQYYPYQGKQDVDAMRIDAVWAGGASSGREINAPDTARSLPKTGELLSEAHTNTVWQYLGGMVPGGDGHFQNATTETVLPQSIGGFLSGQVIHGEANIPDGNKADGTGYLIATGFDFPVSQSVRLGLSYAYGDMDGTLALPSGRTHTTSNQALVYGRWGRDLFVDGFAGASVQTMRTQRTAVLGTGVTYDVEGRTSGVSPFFGLQFGATMNSGRFHLDPAVGVQYAQSNVRGYTETGGLPAMQLSALGNRDLDGRVGFDAHGNFSTGAVILQPEMHAFFVADIAGSTKELTGAFTAFPNEPFTFAVGRTAPEWCEFGLGVHARLSSSVSVGAGYSGILGGRALSYGAWTGTVRVSL